MAQQHNNAAHLMLALARDNDGVAKMQFGILSDSNPTVVMHETGKGDWKVWVGPLATFGGGKIEFGAAVQHIQSRLEAGSYDDVQIRVPSNDSKSWKLDQMFPGVRFAHDSLTVGKVRQLFSDAVRPLPSYGEMWLVPRRA